jgi:hypothetical protein
VLCLHHSPLLAPLNQPAIVLILLQLLTPQPILSPAMDLPLSRPSSPRVSEPREDEHVVKAAKSLRRHLGHEETSNEDTPSRQWSPGAIFWVESAPPSSGGAKCRLPCPEKIMPGEYRIAVIPGQHSYDGRDSTGT